MFLYTRQAMEAVRDTDGNANMLRYIGGIDGRPRRITRMMYTPAVILATLLVSSAWRRIERNNQGSQIILLTPLQDRS